MRALPLTLALLLLLPASAFAAARTAVVNPRGEDASAVIAPDGTAFIASKAIGAQALSVCRLPFRGTACATSVPPTPDVPGGAEPDVKSVKLLRRPADGLLVLLTVAFDLDDDASPDGNSAWVTTSADNATTWSAQAQVGLGQGEVSDATLTADGTAIDLIANDPYSAQYTRLPLAGPPVPPTRDLQPGGEIATDQTIASLPGGGVVVGFAYDGRFGLSRLAPGADPAAGWTPWARAGRVEAFEVQQQFRAGPRGVAFLARRNLLKQIARGTPTLLRSVGGRGVTKGRRIGRGSAIVAPGFDQDPAGGLHVAWVNRGDPGRILYTRTRGPRGRCSFGRQSPQGVAVGTARATLDLRAASPTRAVLVVTNAAKGTVRVVWPTGGDRPTPRRRQRC